ncbi:hypothetical protein ACFLU5_00935 [Bacteroidota bacterium]
MKRNTFILILFFLYSGTSAQEKLSAGFWGLKTIHGEVSLKGLYRRMERVSNSVFEEPATAMITGGIMVNTESYLWDPRFFMLDVDMEYNPLANQENFLVIPDRSEVRTLKKLNVRGTFFKEKPISLSTFVNYNQNFVNREYLTSVKYNNFHWGGDLSLRNKVLPMIIRYQESLWDQEELETGRIYNYRQQNFHARANKSFSNLDNHIITFSHNEYIRQDPGILPIFNRTITFDLSNNIFFDRKKQYYLNSMISNFDQSGRDVFQRFQVDERITAGLTKKLKLTGNYRYYKRNELESQQYDLHSIRGALNHQLFQSLRSNLYYEIQDLKHSLYDEKNRRSGVNFQYTKKMPTNGRLSLSYMYNHHYQDVDAEPTLIQIRNEEHILADDQVVMLDRPFILIETVVVKDPTGTIIYDEDLDYVLFERNDYMEVQRIPGGQIPDGAPIQVDYSAYQQGSYQFTSKQQAFSASLFLFKNLVETYFRTSNRDYDNVIASDFLTLLYFDQFVYGARINIGPIRGGVEFDDYQSNINPYEMKRYYLQFMGKIGKTVRYSINGDMRDFYRFISERREIFSNVYGKITYQIRAQSKVNFEFGYRKQEGREIDLDLITGRTELLTNYRQLFISMGLDVYRRLYLDETINFNNINVKVVRRF